MTNETVRELLSNTGITTDNVTKGQLSDLVNILDDHLKKSGCFRGTFAANPLRSGADMKYLTCRADYFDDRAAVYFHQNGFIGFGGWASVNNLKPILEAVVEWCELIASKWRLIEWAQDCPYCGGEIEVYTESSLPENAVCDGDEGRCTECKCPASVSADEESVSLSFCWDDVDCECDWCKEHREED